MFRFKYTCSKSSFHLGTYELDLETYFDNALLAHWTLLKEYNVSGIIAFFVVSP